MNLPRILIIGQPFNRHTGGGITLTNLFTGWDKDCIAVASIGHLMNNVSTDVCDKYYLLGDREFKWRFPFHMLQRNFRSGVLRVKVDNSEPGSSSGINLRKVLIDKLFYPALEWIGLFHNIRNLKVSDEFIKWVSEYQPEVLYLQVSSRETVLFASKLLEVLKVPSVIHFMDDWPSAISTKGPLKRYWKRIIDSELKDLINKVDLHLSISSAMSEEYKSRYGKEFIPFHNPVDLNLWKPFTKSDFFLTGDHFKVLYSGRIGPGIGSSVVEAAEAVRDLSLKGKKIRLYIQSANIDPDIKRKLARYSCVCFNPVARYTDLPGIFTDADILLLANDFDNKGEAFLKYSMPTKASEYMISGTPMLVYSPPTTAISKFCMENACAACVTEHGYIAIADALENLMGDEDYRRRISHNAVKIAKELFDATMVRNRIRNELKLLASSKVSFTDKNQASD